MTSELNVNIRTLQSPEEAKDCARLMCQSEPWITLRRSYEEALGIVSDASKEVYVARATDEFVGFLVLSMRDTFAGYVRVLCVVPQCRGKGIGSTLLKFAEQRIFTESPNVFLCVSSFNQDARRLYERLGYELVGELKEYVVRGHSELLMRKSIGPLREFKPSGPIKT
jgi:ribosomal-protein-alanine N-acetyltransferase